MGRRAAAGNVYHALADTTRRRILNLLAERERPVMELVDSFSISQPSISEHLRVLREAGMVKTRQAGRQRFYSLDAFPLREVLDWVAFFEPFWEGKLEGSDGDSPTVRSVGVRPPGGGFSVEID